MAITATQSKFHWTYFVALEHDLEVIARYIEFAEPNMSVFSLELAHLLMAASSEVDVVAKLLCDRLAPNAQRKNIDHYRAVLCERVPDLPRMEVVVPRYGLRLQPWSNWASDKNPEWWRGYNNVKHERNAYFHEATLKNALNSLAALLCTVFHYYQLETPEDLHGRRGKETFRSLKPDAALMRLEGDFYYAAIVT